MNPSFKKGFYDAIPTLFGYIGIGIAAGMIGKTSNLSVLEITLMAIVIYAGSAQFIIAGLMLVATPISAIILTVFLVNSRHLLMSMTVAPYFKKYSLFNNIAIGSLLTDETFAVMMTQATKSNQLDANWMHGLNITAYLSWIFACFLGAIIGGMLPDPMLFGMDFALTAMFLGLLYFQFKSNFKQKKLNTVLVLLAVVLSVIILMRFLSAELAVLVATLLGCLLGILLDKSPQ